MSPQILFLVSLHPGSDDNAEVVLYELIANFAFELSETPVVWNMSGISFPTPNKESTKPELWLRVRRFRKD